VSQANHQAMESQVTDRATGSVMLVRIFGDRIEITEQVSDDRTDAFITELRRLGLDGTVAFNTPCG